MIWHQGEADATSLTNANAYEANLTDLISRVRQDVFGGNNAPFVIGSLSNSQDPSIETPGSSWNVLRQAQESVAANDTQVGFVNTDGYTTRPNEAIHFDHEGQIDLGEGFAAEMLRLENTNTLIEVTFDGTPNDSNSVFGVITNTQSHNSGGSWDQTTGVVNRGSANNSTAGAVSATTIDIPASTPLTLTVNFDSTSGPLGANGFFVGFQEADGGANAGDELWNNLAPSFGLTIDGGNRLGSYVVAPGGRNSSGAFQDAPAFGTTTQSSFNSGFTVTLTVDATGWDIEITGLETSGGASISGGSGTWSDLAFDFNDFTNGMRVSFATQGNGGGGSLNLASINLTTGGDSDMDGLTDSYEEANGTNPNVNDAALDFDNDGLTNLQEFLGQNSSGILTGFGQTLSGTADSDGDTLNDGEELAGTLNPWTAGVLGATPGDPTNPNEQDSDQDSTNDNVELTNGTDPNALPPNTGPLFPFVDTDGDSYSDIAETAFGSDPSDSTEIPDHSSSSATPNVVIIYADDLGLGDMSAYGDLFGTPSPAVTPRMNALAEEGTLFTQAHSANGVCTPSRYSLLTAKYNWREFDNISTHYGFTSAISELPRASDVTIAEFLKTQAYDTAAFGKWHLGGSWFAPGTNNRITNNPTNPTSIDWARPVEGHAVSHGFDTFQGLAASINFGPYVYLENDRNQIWDATLNSGAGAFRDATNSDTFQWLTTGNLNSSVIGAKDSRASLGDPTYRQVDAGPFMITQVEEFIADRASSGDPDPFFAYVSLYSPHTPWAITPSFEDSSAANFDYADFMREVDDRIGRVIDAIDNNGYHDNTVIIITSDNGPENIAMTQSLNNGRDPNGPLRGNKRDVWEGGTRVPFVIRWPGQAAAGLKISTPIWQGDIFATVAAYLGVELPNSIAPDGESFLNLIRGQQKPSPQRGGIVISSIRSDLGLKTNDGWKFIDATAGGHAISWDSSNNSLSSPTGINQGTPKQLFHLAFDLGEDDNLISSLSNNTDIRNELTTRTGFDLLDTLDQLRVSFTTDVYPRIPDNDADSLPNSFELLHGLDLNSPKDADEDLDGDGANNLDEFIAGTNPVDSSDFFRITDLQDSATEFTVTWPSVLGKTYTVEWSTDLQNWTEHSEHLAASATQSATLNKAVIDSVDAITGNLDELFVRVSVAGP